jgi:hypothetical protein
MDQIREKHRTDVGKPAKYKAKSQDYKQKLMQKMKLLSHREFRYP